MGSSYIFYSVGYLKKPDQKFDPALIYKQLRYELFCLRKSYTIYEIVSTCAWITVCYYK